MLLPLRCRAREQHRCRTAGPAEDVIEEHGVMGVELDLEHAAGRERQSAAAGFDRQVGGVQSERSCAQAHVAAEIVGWRAVGIQFFPLLQE